MISFSRNTSGRDVAQAVSRWLPPAAARVRVRAACGFCDGQSGTGAGFLRVLRLFPANHSTNFSIIIITRGWRNRPIGGRSSEWTQLDSTPPLYQLKKISRNTNSVHFNHFLDGLLIVRTDCVKNLEVMLDSKLHFRRHGLTPYSLRH
jgi:hypothetical protein